MTTGGGGARRAAAKWALYPDASVICGELEPAAEDRDAATNPRVIIEVLSPSTEAYDRGEKFELYQTLPSFQEYLMIASQRVRIEVVRRDVDGTWRHEYFGPGGRVPLASVNATIEVDAVYLGGRIQGLETRQRDIASVPLLPRAPCPAFKASARAHNRGETILRIRRVSTARETRVRRREQSALPLKR